jgi:hypothetical protein
VESSRRVDLLELVNTGERCNLVAKKEDLIGETKNWLKPIKLATRFGAPGRDHGDRSRRGRRGGSGGV